MEPEQNLADKNFRATNTQIMQTLVKKLNTNMMKMAPWVGNLNKNTRITKNKQWKIWSHKSTITEMKNCGNWVQQVRDMRQ